MEIDENYERRQRLIKMIDKECELANSKSNINYNMKKPKEIELSPLFDEILNEHKKRERRKIIKNPYNYITLIIIISLIMPLFIHNNPRNCDADIVLVGITFFFLMFALILIIILKK